MNHNIFALALTTVVFTACGSRTPDPVDAASEVSRLYLEAGTPSGKGFSRDVKGLDPLPTTPETPVAPVTPVSDMTLPTPTTPQESQPQPAVDPWNDNRPVSPEDGQRLQAFYEQAWEFFQAAADGDNAATNWPRAADLFLKASRLPDQERRQTCLYNAACAWARHGHKTNGLKYLSLAIDKGFKDFAHIRSDSDLDSLRQEIAYLELMKKHAAELPENANPPEEGK